MERPTVLLEYRPSPDDIARLRTRKPVKAGPRKPGRAEIDAPRHLYFGDQGLLYLPLRLALNGTDLFGRPDNPWITVPLDVVPAGWVAIHRAVACHHDSFGFDNKRLRFEVLGDWIRAQYTVRLFPRADDEAGEQHSVERSREGFVPLLDFARAWGTLTDDVRAYLLQELPEMTRSRDYGPWMREGREALLRNLGLPRIAVDPPSAVE
jgi:hypothetical protein